ncbi:unnamed protein product [Echinostoma caproni]|uniref:RNase_PH domain-containing protein n=1 Tax=Echinostoma caproni TaxID=27848 RepID=A0A3P8L749_9TREM|nr:unnamed protein product [Echinostoma caproni]
MCIVSGDASDPRTVAAALNAASLALLHSGLPLRATIATVCVPIGSSAMALAIDVSHLFVRHSDQASRHQGVGNVFAVYSSQPARSITSGNAPEKSLGFDSAEALGLLDPDPTEPAASACYRQAMDLANVMITQLASAKVV